MSAGDATALLMEFERILRDYTVACQAEITKASSDDPMVRGAAYFQTAALKEHLLDMYAKALVRRS